MHVGVYELRYVEVVVFDEAVERKLLILVYHARVDYCGLTGVGIPHYIGVDPKHIECKSLDFQHGNFDLLDLDIN